MAEAAENETQHAPMVYGNALTRILRVCYEKSDVEGCMGILPYHSCQIVLGICQKHIEMKGNNVEGWEFEALDEEGERILEKEKEIEEEWES